MNRRWICNDVWMDILPCFDHAQLGLKLAFLSPRFNALVDKHFDGKRELTIWREIRIRKEKNGPELKLSVWIDDHFVKFPLPDRPLPSKIHFKHLRIGYIDHRVIAFLRSNHQIFDKRGTDFELWLPSSRTADGQTIWDVLVHEIWPFFSAKIDHLGLNKGDHLDSLLRLISPTILTDLNQLYSIYSCLLPDSIGDLDEPNATISAGQALSKWLHIPLKDGQPKRLRCGYYTKQNSDWINNFKEKFLRATISSVNYLIHFTVRVPSMPIVPFELENEWTKEKLTLAELGNCWIMQRYKIGETTAVQQRTDENYGKSNNVSIRLIAINCIGPLSPSPSAEVEEAGQSITKVPSTDKDE